MTEPPNCPPKALFLLEEKNARYWGRYEIMSLQYKVYIITIRITSFYVILHMIIPDEFYN